MRFMCAVVVSALAAGVALGQSVNIDFDTTGATAGAGVPSNTFGGARSSPGVWNSVSTTTAGPIALTNTNGTNTGVTLSRTWTGTPVGNFGSNNANTSGDYEKLLDDGESIAVGQTVTYTFNGYTPGTYALCIYAIAPDNATYRTQVNLGTGNFSVGGTMPVNSFALDTTHHYVIAFNLPGGPVSITATGLTGFGTINGLQLQLMDSNYRFVKSSAPAGGDGLSWATPYRSLDTALADANAHPTITNIWLTNGPYTPTVQTSPGDARSVAFSIRSGLSIYGGFVGTESNPSQRTFSGSTRLTGELGAAGIADNAYHVIKSTGTVSLDGLLIQAANNNHNDAAPPAFQSLGGAIYHDVGTLNVTQCTFINNACSTSAMAGFGGAILAGGALNVKTSTFSSNSARFGGAIWASGTLRVCNCDFVGNYAYLAGGAIGQEYNSPSAVVANCLFRSNNADAETGIQGGAAFRGDGTSSLINCTFTGNGGNANACVIATSGVGTTPSPNAITVRNCIVWGNSTPPLYGGSTLNRLTVEYSDVQGGSIGFPGSHNIDADPKFIAAPNICTLRPHSPCIDSATFSGSPADFLDLDGDFNVTEALPLDLLLNPRRFEDTGTPNGPLAGSPPLDMGAYEFQFISCAADLDDGSGAGLPDGGVTIDDLLFFFTAFEAGSSAADLDNGSGSGNPDGGVTIDDLLFFLTHFEGGC